MARVGNRALNAGSRQTAWFHEAGRREAAFSRPAADLGPHVPAGSGARTDDQVRCKRPGGIHRPTSVRPPLKLVLSRSSEADFPLLVWLSAERRARTRSPRSTSLPPVYEWVLVESRLRQIGPRALWAGCALGSKTDRSGLVAAFLRAGILVRMGRAGYDDGYPQAGIPRHSRQHAPFRASTIIRRGRQHEQPRRALAAALKVATYRLVRYADDFVVLVADREHAEHCAPRQRGPRPDGPTPLGSETRIVHIDEASTSWAFASCVSASAAREARHLHVPRQRSLAELKARLRTMTVSDGPFAGQSLPPAQPGAPGWTAYFRTGLEASFGYLRAFVCWRVSAGSATSISRPTGSSFAATAFRAGGRRRR